MQRGLAIIEHAGFIVAQLYQTKIAVIELNTGRLVLAHGGYRTLSTTRAMNTAFRVANIGGKAYIKEGTMYYRTEDDRVFRVERCPLELDLPERRMIS